MNALSRIPLRTWKLIATVAGVIGILLAVVFPLLPVKENTAKFSWPQNGSLGQISAPLVGYTPLSANITVACATLDAMPASGGTVLSTLPQDGVRPIVQGLTITADENTLQVIQRGVVMASAQRADLAAGRTITDANECGIVVATDPTHSAVHINGVPEVLGDSADRTNVDVADPWLRPQITGVYTDLPADASQDGLHVGVVIDTRFDSTMTTVKKLALWVGIAMVLLSLVALGALDLTDGRGSRRIMPQHWLRPRLVDFAVIAGLAIFWFIGANTSDDGYQYTMGEEGGKTGYLINYFRSFGVPENPFGWNDYLFTLLQHIWDAPLFLRTPALLAGALSWFLLSREVIPRLGKAVSGSQTAYWSAGMVFLAAWLPFNNGLRPEPFVVLGSLLTWVSVERSIATGRLLPFAFAVPIAAFTLGMAPSGLLAGAALLGGTRPVITRIIRRRHTIGLLPQLLPIIAGGTAFLFAMFADQTLASTRAGTDVKFITGPTLDWWEEGVRYYWLTIDSADSSLPRRFAVFSVLLALFLVLIILLRKRRPPRLAVGPVWRLVAVFFATMILMAFTPTKWTHQLGLYAGYGAALAAVAGALVAPPMLKSIRNRTFVWAATLFMLAFSFAGPNTWWIMASYGVPWWGSQIAFGGIKLTQVFALAALAVTALGILYHLRPAFVAALGAPSPAAGPGTTGATPATSGAGAGNGNGNRRRFAWFQPLPVIAGFIVLVELLTFAKAAYKQRDSWSWFSNNLAAVTGDRCGMARDILMESDPNSGLLQPLSIPGQPAPSASEALLGESSGFSPDGLPGDFRFNDDSAGDSNDNGDAAALESAPTPEQLKVVTVNGSHVPMPFGLDPARTPVLGTNGSDANASLTSGWYQLPERTADTPLITMSAAGAIEAPGLDDYVEPGQKVVLELGRTNPDGTVTGIGERIPTDVGQVPNWRNLRFPTADIPAETTAVRIVAADTSFAGDQWIAITPPRLTKLQTAQEVFGTDTVVNLDFMMAFVFPCQNQVSVKHGVTEQPEYRVAPDYAAKRDTSNTWEGWKTGGPLGITDAMYWDTMVPAYLRNDWGRDWGSITRYTNYEQTVPAELELSTETVNGWSDPGPIRAEPY